MITRTYLNALHRVTRNPLYDHGMRKTTQKRADDMERKYRQERHSHAVVNTVRCQDRAARHFRRVDAKLREVLR